jgi:membrane-bound lytic murein transglycosylase MltF
VLALDHARLGDQRDALCADAVGEQDEVAGQAPDVGRHRDQKHKGDMKAASLEYKQQQGSGVTDAIERKIKGKIKQKVFQKGDAAIDTQVSNPALRAALHAGLHAGVDTLAGSGKAPLDVQQFLNQGASNDLEGGSVSQVLDKLAAGSALAKVGSEIADLFGYGHADVRQYMD